MLLATIATAVVIVALLADLVAPRLREAYLNHRARRARAPRVAGYDPGRELRAEQRARELLRSCVNEEEWAMYRDLGFIRVWGRHDGGGRPPYAYLVYPHKPIVGYLPQTRELLNEYCVEFPDTERPYGSARLPESDDVLAKWMALTGDEERLLKTANLHMPGRQVDPRAVRRDLWRLGEWERHHARRRYASTPDGPDDLRSQAQLPGAD
ncbi:MAG TPA: hypothetical protein VNB64_11220 [Solirubrobacteraceae bacterium]|nr:hypothetical protein [Solirubrobacteraceae bacterium]